MGREGRRGLMGREREKRKGKIEEEKGWSKEEGR